ncbi:hypothetical protein [Ornithinibacillus bavariensis]|uniref:DUF3888 domain-containing protein n=1 Tax=Ornithinibacillus bavariensis TaxID=545502 RepID=A0A919X7B2_9BACI|nr:hypothetical protein [Ornithinibacillus bavariensis]GIO26369.1 hypothetical protein J43TS3_09800 [Ornithinibacillus bavariensis]
MSRVIISFAALLLFSLNNLVDATTEEIKPFAEDWYVTTEDIIWDIIFPAIDKKVIEEYGGQEDSGFGWQKQRIVKIVYNNNHSYDISIKIQVPTFENSPFAYSEDLVKVRIYPSCDSPKIACDNNFNVEVLDYKHLK